jgi:hypothetical protein
MSCTSRGCRDECSARSVCPRRTAPAAGHHARGPARPLRRALLQRGCSARAAWPRRIGLRRGAARVGGVLRVDRGSCFRGDASRRARGAGDPVRRGLLTGGPFAGGAGRRVDRPVTHECDRADQRRGPDGHGAGRRDARATQSRDQGHGPVLPDRPRRQRHARRHGGHAGLRYQCGALRHHEGQRAGDHRGQCRRFGDAHRHARQEIVGRLRPDAPARRQRRHPGRDDGADGQALPAARGGERGGTRS